MYAFQGVLLVFFSIYQHSSMTLPYNPNFHNQIRRNQLTRFHTQINKFPRRAPTTREGKGNVEEEDQKKKRRKIREKEAVVKDRRQKEEETRIQRREGKGDKKISVICSDIHYCTKLSYFLKCLFLVY